MLGVCIDYKNRNYGSKLQALATMRMLTAYCSDCEIIWYNKRTIGFFIRAIPRLLNFNFLSDRYDQVQRNIEYHRHPEIKKNICVRNKAMESFDKQFDERLSTKYASYNELVKQCKDRYDKVITCSDQLWSPAALGSKFYNLQFASEKMAKISWASSFGVDSIPWYQKSRTKAYLQRIQHISVRENRGAEIIKELTGREVPVLMDPVFVYSREEWNEMIPVREVEWKNYLFCYFLGSNKKHRKQAQDFAQKQGLTIVTVPHLDRYNQSDEGFGDFALYDITPADFLNILRNAEYVCTDSFHGAAFSVIFRKPFLVFNRYNNRSKNSKNSRIDSFCDNLGLNDRRISEEEIIEEKMMRQIAYEEVEEKILHYRNKTKEYLNKVFGE